MASIKQTDSKEKMPDSQIARWKLGQYIRLSKEDITCGKNITDTIANQKALLDDYCKRHIEEFENIEPPYADDEHSLQGSNMEGFQRLLSDIYAKKINCVIVKDLSRISPNYTDAKTLIENLFLRINIRFISLEEGIDSYIKPENIWDLAVSIEEGTNDINDNYCYQTSEKIRRVFDIKRSNGQFIGSFAAYGYMKSPQDRNTLIIDSEAAETVKKIYELFLSGMTKSAIVRSLNEQGVPCPTEYKRLKGLNYQHPSGSKKPLWSAKTINDILKNRLYAGDMVQGRQRVKSYKTHIQEQVPENYWYIVENTHEPIIERAVFEKAQKLLNRKVYTIAHEKKLHLLSGFLRCADCGKAMCRSQVKGSVYYFCRTYKEQSKTACTKHSIKHDKLENAVLYSIRQQIYITSHYTNALQYCENTSNEKNTFSKIQQLIGEKEKEHRKIMDYKQALYQDWKDGEITYADYIHMNGNYDEQISVLNEALKKFRLKYAQTQKSVGDESSFSAVFKKYENIDKLTREILTELVDYIEVHENGYINIKFKHPFNNLRD